ncbi:MAG: hypothetical protein EOO40_09190 [Deltaproteobacteria bacterium]|nr:MAG: hypothetical protein EOO40_09190 [Deltaproteobacteria bacterium]
MRQLPLSGSEPLLDMDQWAKPRAVRNHNCYAFGMDDYFNSAVPVPKQQPGDRSGANHTLFDLSTCEIVKRILADNPGHVYKEAPERPCRQGFHKVFVFNDPNPKTEDFHFMRQVGDILYTLKPGETERSVARKFGLPASKVFRLRGGRLLLSATGLWAHKMGHATGALLEDSCGKVIRDPRTACRTVGERNYTLNCGALCARSGRVRTRKDANYVPSR